MIDPADQQTHPLPLDTTPVKRGRGRPSTGKALTPAQKQKAYRERLKMRENKLEGTSIAYDQVCEEKREISMKLIKTEATVMVLEQKLEKAANDSRDLEYLLDILKKVLNHPTYIDRLHALHEHTETLNRMIEERDLW